MSSDSLMTRPAPGALVSDSPRTSLAVPRLPYPSHPILDAPKPFTRAPLVFGLLVCLVFVVGFGAWAVLAPLAEAAIAPGTIKVEGQRRTIQHLEGGIVREILVRDGSKVQAGQVLVRLDDIQADSTAETQRAQRFVLLAQLARLNAELRRAREISFPAELLASDNARAQEAISTQRALFDARQTSLLTQISVLQARIEQQEAAISGARGQLGAKQRQYALIRQEETMRRGLVQQGLARLPDLLAVQRAMAGLEGELQDINGQIDRSQATIAEAQRQMQQVIDQRLQEVSTEQTEARTKLAETEERLRAATDVVTRREITAPEAGTIVNLRLFTVGAVLRAGDPVMDLVPDNDRLVAEVNVSPTDIDVVYPGLQAEIRLPAFKQRLVPYLHGHVTWVAADVTTNEQTRQQYFRAFIAIDQEQLGRLPNVFLTPGMPVEGHIQIGQRSFFRYITQPIRDSFHRAFREQ